LPSSSAIFGAFLLRFAGRPTANPNLAMRLAGGRSKGNACVYGTLHRLKRIFFGKPFEKRML
jgi:hypothetical protein